MENRYTARRYSKYKDESKNRLSKVLKKKIQTTMIGAISSIEEYFGFLWEDSSEQSEKMKQIFLELRSEILDKGNNQLRNIDVELSQYDVEWLRYRLEMPVRPIRGDNT